MARSRRRSRSRKVGWANKLVIGRIAAIAGVIVAGTGGVFYQLGGWNGSTDGVTAPQGVTAETDGITQKSYAGDITVVDKKPAFPDGSGLTTESPRAQLANNPNPALGSLSGLNTSNTLENGSAGGLPVQTPQRLADNSTPGRNPSDLGSPGTGTFGDIPGNSTPNPSDSLSGMPPVGRNDLSSSDSISSLDSGSGFKAPKPLAPSAQSSSELAKTPLPGIGGSVAASALPPSLNQSDLNTSDQRPESNALNKVGRENSASENLFARKNTSSDLSGSSPPASLQNKSPLPPKNFGSNPDSLAASPSLHSDNLTSRDLGGSGLSSGIPSSSGLPTSRPLPGTGGTNSGIGISQGRSNPETTASPHLANQRQGFPNTTDNGLASNSSLAPLGQNTNGRPVDSNVGPGRTPIPTQNSQSHGGSAVTEIPSSNIANSPLPNRSLSQAPTGFGNDGSNQSIGGGTGGSLGSHQGSDYPPAKGAAGLDPVNTYPRSAADNLNAGSRQFDQLRNGVSGLRNNGSNNQQGYPNNQYNQGLAGRQQNPNDRQPINNDLMGQRNRNVQAATYRDTPSPGGRSFGSGAPRQPITRMASARVSNLPGSPLQNTPQSASLVLTKKAPGQIQVNVPTKFVVSLRNTGRATAKNVVVRDHIPKGTKLIRTNPKFSGRDGDLLEWGFDSVAAGGEVLIEMELLPMEAGEIGSVAEVAFSTVAGCKTKCTRPVLSITHTANPEVMLGDQLLMNITVRNTGDGPAKNVMISESLPAGFSHPSISGQNSRGIEAMIGTLMPGQSITKQLAVRAQAVGQVTNTVRVTADGKISNNHSLNIKVIAPQLKVSAEGPSRRFIKRVATHDFQVVNNGTAAASDLMLRVTLPPGLKYQSSAPAGAYDARQHSVFWRMNQLVSGGRQKVTVSTLPLQSGNQAMKFTALASRNQPQTVTKNLAVEQMSELFFDVDDTENVIEIGAKTNYVVRIQNQGKQFDSDVQVQVTIPAGLKPLNVIAPVRHQTQNGRNGETLIVFESIARLNPGAAGKRIEIQTEGTSAGDHQVHVRVNSRRWPTWVSKQHTTKVYADGTSPSYNR